MTLYVYGIVRADHPGVPEGTQGVGDPPGPVHLLSAGELAAIVGEAPKDLKPKRRDLLAHQEVLSTLSRGGTVLPMTFGSLSSDDETVRKTLTEHADIYLERLDHLAGKVEYNVKASHREEAILHQVLSEDPVLREKTKAANASGGGTYEQRLEIGELIARSVRAHEQRDAAVVQDTLAPAAEETSPGPEGQGWLANVSFLVDREHAGRFLESLDTLARERPQLELRANGPLPPYSFAGQAAGAGRAAGMGAGQGAGQAAGKEQPHGADR